MRTRTMCLMVTLLAAGPWCCAGAAPGLVAQVYPGAVHDARSGDATFQVYLSKDPVSKVKAWYRRQGRFSADDGNTLWNADGEDTKAGVPVGARDPGIEVKNTGLVVMHQGEVARRIKDMTMTRDIGVLLQHMVRSAPASSTPEPATAQPSAPQGDFNAMMRQLNQMGRQIERSENQMTASESPADRKIAAMSDLFEGLRNELPKGHHTKTELLALYAKYRHLETAWYPTVKRTDGSLISYDRLLLNRYRARLSAQMPGASQAPLAGGQDMAALAEQARAAATADRWRYWTGFLKKLDAHAYRTRIWINTKPQGWGF